MSSAFLCQCNHIAVPAVIEGSTVLVCRHLLQGSQYRTDPHHLPCSFKLEDSEPELQPAVRATVLHCKPRPFKALEFPPGSDLLDLHRPKSEIAASRAHVAEDAMEIDGAPIDGAQLVLGEQGPAPMDLRAWQKRCRMLELRLQASEEDRRKMKVQLVELEEERQRDLLAAEEQCRAREEQCRTREEQCRARVRAKDEEAEVYRKKYENVRTELHDLRRSTRIIVSSALQPHRSSSPSPI